MVKKSSAWIHMVWDFSSVTFLLRLCIWPFIFILLVLIAVYWTLRYCVQRTHASPRHCHRCGCTGLFCCPQIGTCCCCLTATAGNILLLKAYLVDTWVELLHSGTSKQNEWTLCGQLMVTKKSFHVLLNVSLVLELTVMFSIDVSCEESVMVLSQERAKEKHVQKTCSALKLLCNSKQHLATNFAKVCWCEQPHWNANGSFFV